MRRWRVLTLGITDVYLHPAMLVYALYAVVTGHGLFAAVSMLSILLHEGAHATAALVFGQPPRSIEITPLGAVMRLEDDSCLSPLKRVIMLLAGPVMTLLLCWLSLILTRRGLLSSVHGRMLFLSNISILLLNLLPALPLDGGRLLSLLLSMFLPLHAVHRTMQAVGSALGIGMIALNIYASWQLGGWNLSLAIAGCCLMYSAVAATTTQAMAELRQFMDRKIALERKGKAHVTWIAVLHMQPLRQLVRLLPPGKIAVFACIEAGSMRPLGWMPESEVIQQYLLQPEMTFGEAVSFCSKRQIFAKNDTI